MQNRFTLAVMMITAFALQDANGIAQNDITFQVDLRIKSREKVFQPGAGDRVLVRGSFNAWANRAEIMLDPEADGIYSLLHSFSGAAAPLAHYQYAILKHDGLLLAEDRTPVRTVALTGAPQQLPPVYFDADSVADAPVVAGKIRFSLDATVLRTLGAFAGRQGDTLQIRAPFNGWGQLPGNAALQPDIFDPDRFNLLAAVPASPKTPVLFRYYLGRQGENGSARMQETPLLTGGMARTVTFAGSMQQQAPPAYFNDVPPAGVIPAGQPVACIFRVDMAAATADASTPFDPRADSVFLVLMDPWWAALQGRLPGVQEDVRLTDPDGDLVYEGKLAVIGPAYYGLLYRYAFGPDAGHLTRIEGGDLKVHPSRVDYIMPDAADAFPEAFTLPAAVWQKGPGLPVALPPLDPAPPANKAPYVARAIPDQRLPLQDVPFYIDLRGDQAVFRDPNGDSLHYAVQLSDTHIAEIELDNSLLAITPKAPGRTNVTLTADDRITGKVSTAFAVEITHGNEAPRIINPIDDQTLTVAGALFVRNLNLVFRDPDDDPMTFRAVSSVPTVATAIVIAGMLRLSPKLAGETTVTIIADDNRGGSASTAFRVTVLAGNQPPRVSSEIPAQTLTLNGDPFIRNLEAKPPVFEDPNGDVLQYVARSTNPSAAAQEINGTALQVSPVDTGSTVITVIASDRSGGADSTAFAVRVVAENANQPPQIANSIAGQTLVLDGTSFTINLDAPPAIFSDPDQDPLQYIATSSDANVAHVSIFGSLLTVAPVGLGGAIVEITASDARGGTIRLAFTVQIVQNHPPVIAYTPRSEQDAGQPIVVEANITDDTGVTRAVLRYRRGGDSTFVPVAMTNTGPLWQATVSGGDVTSRGLEYCIEAFDQHDSLAQTPLNAVRISLPGEGERPAQPQPAGDAQTAYRLFSVPFQLHNPDPAEVLLDDLGEYDRKKWRFFELAPDQAYREFGETSGFAPGRAFWLIVAEAGRMIDSGSGTTNPTTALFEITLQPGWNLIGNPFNFAIPLANLQLRSTSAPPRLRAFNGSWIDADSVAEIIPFSGYALFNDSVAPDILYIDPELVPAASQARKMAAPPHLWQVRVIGRCQSAADRDNIAAVNAQAKNGRDALDQPEPPAIGEYISVAFAHPEWQRLTAIYSTDIRAPGADGYSWAFSVESNIRDRVVLEFQGIESVPADFGVWLFDAKLQLRHNLRRAGRYVFLPASREKRRRFQLITGTDNYLSGTPAAGAGLPADFELGQNFPNPFNPQTSIRFGLPVEAHVTLEIYDLLGRRLVTLVRGELLPAGYHVAIWDGRTAAGAPVASGVYFCTLSAGGGTRIRKMTLLR